MKKRLAKKIVQRRSALWIIRNKWRNTSADTGNPAADHGQ